MFQFPGFTFHKLCIHLWIHGVSHVSFLIRKSSDLWLCAPTRSLSQLITSFIGSWCQGIHHAPFVAWPIVMILVLKLSLQRIFLGYVVLTYLYNYVQFSKNILSVINAYYVTNKIKFEQTWSLKIEQKVKKQILICTSQASCLLDFSIERRWSSRRFSYGYLVTTSPQSLTLP